MKRPACGGRLVVVMTCLAGVAPACAADLDFDEDPQPVELAPGRASSWSYGSGSFGTWSRDRFGLPVYDYRGCNEDLDCVEPDAVHLLGNDVANALAHAGGPVELYTARSFHRFANKYDEAERGYAGGFGWVRDGESIWSTLAADLPLGAEAEQAFGVGYRVRRIEHNGLRVEHVVHSGEKDAVLLERIALTNTSSSVKDLRYFDYWDVAWWLPKRDPNFDDTSHYDPAPVVTFYDAGRAALKAVSLSERGDQTRPSLATDPVPQAAFVAVLEGDLHGFDTVESALFGDGGRALPARVAAGQLGGSLDATGTLRNQDAVLATQMNLTLAPGETRELRVLYGLAPRGKEDAVIDRYRAAPRDALARGLRAWSDRVPRVSVPGQPWIGREMAWSYYYLLAGTLRDDYFRARSLNQGSIYLYEWGLNAGPRASLRHLVPLIYTDPGRAREALVRQLRMISPFGELPYATAGHGAWNKLGFWPSDSVLWLLWSVTEYVNATRDFALLDEPVAMWCAEGQGECGEDTVFGLLVRSYAYLVYVVGTGPNGLIRLLNADWDDNMSSLSAVNPWLTMTFGESTMNTAMAVAFLPRFAALAERRGKRVLAAGIRARTAALGDALADQWRGEFYNRGYVYDWLGRPIEVGADNLWLASNGMALLGNGLMTPEQRASLVAGIARHNLAGSPVGLASQGAPIPVGIGTPGTWYSLTGPTIEGLMMSRNTPGARALAWQAFRRQTLANHAEVHPDIWYGIWSGPDMYFTPIDVAAYEGSGLPVPAEIGPAGATWCFPELMCMRDLPIANMFSHSEPLLGSLRMAGVRVDDRGHTIDPAYPNDRFVWSHRGYAVAYWPRLATGRIGAVANAAMELRIRVPRRVNPARATVLVNGGARSHRVEGDLIVVDVQLVARRDLTWVVF